MPAACLTTVQSRGKRFVIATVDREGRPHHALFNIAGAIEGYRRILREHPVAAGIKFNIGQAALSKNDLGGAAGILEHALHDCANYQPAAAALASCYERLGETEKLHELRKQWGVEEEQSLPSS